MEFSKSDNTTAIFRKLEKVVVTESLTPVNSSINCEKCNLKLNTDSLDFINTIPSENFIKFTVI